ncbi:hypothetical protein AVEN_244765-1 [Araneus ventricosus]|uniref:Uncharacterized protein n=1 Tax=Araneus ventricosus TaxID=182803 RepID=A0A4Y2BU03_ARAVE|nr:hypothetical protein AVEN_244765-1 [Araneus ventricosus]
MVTGARPVSTKDRRVWRLLDAKSYVVAKRPPVGVVRKFAERVPAQVSSSSSDRSSKLRGADYSSKDKRFCEIRHAFLEKLVRCTTRQNKGMKLMKLYPTPGRVAQGVKVTSLFPANTNRHGAKTVFYHMVLRSSYYRGCTFPLMNQLTNDFDAA